MSEIFIEEIFFPRALTSTDGTVSKKKYFLA